jgi:hypothetical protein
MGKLLQSASEIFLQLAAAYEQDRQENELKLDVKLSELKAEQSCRLDHIESRVDKAEEVAAENREAIKATLEAILSRL